MIAFVYPNRVHGPIYGEPTLTIERARQLFKENPEVLEIMQFEGLNQPPSIRFKREQVDAN